MTKAYKFLLAISIIPQYLIVSWLSHYPEFIETYYSNGMYPFISKILRYAFGWLPFSVGDIIYTIAGIYIIRWLVLNKKRLIIDTKQWVLEVLTACSLLYFAFHLFWGMNYYRLPLHKTLNLDNTYSFEELQSVTEKLIEKANTIHLTITKNDTIKVHMPFTKNKLLTMSDKGYYSLAKTYPHLSHNPSSTKLSLYSLPLTYMGFSGYLNPLTNEAQIDGLIPLFKYPTTICHEKAHQIGYAAENETNFIGCLAAIYNDDIYFKYSGYIFALRHCLNEVYLRDETLYHTLVEKVNKGILKNYQESYEFWDSYQNPLEPLFKKTYSTFLKANNQDKGIESYSYAVALLVNYFKNEQL
jgi:effector-binding domain-containing protein